MEAIVYAICLCAALAALGLIAYHMTAMVYHALCAIERFLFWISRKKHRARMQSMNWVEPTLSLRGQRQRLSEGRKIKF